MSAAALGLRQALDLITIERESVKDWRELGFERRVDEVRPRVVFLGLPRDSRIARIHVGGELHIRTVQLSQLAIADSIIELMSPVQARDIGRLLSELSRQDGAEGCRHGP